MMNLLPTESVTVLTLVEAVDSFGETQKSWEPAATLACIVGPASTEDLGTDFDLFDEVHMTVHIPSTFTASVANARFEFRGLQWNVLGDPQAYTSSPLSFDRHAIVSKVVLDEAGD